MESDENSPTRLAGSRGLPFKVKRSFLSPYSANKALESGLSSDLRHPARNKWHGRGDVTQTATVLQLRMLNGDLRIRRICGFLLGAVSENGHRCRKVFTPLKRQFLELLYVFDRQILFLRPRG